jgi:hypothetical protein
MTIAQISGYDPIDCSALDVLLKTHLVFARAREEVPTSPKPREVSATEVQMLAENPQPARYIEGGRVFAIVGIYFLHRQVILCDKDTLQPPAITVKLDNIEVVGFRALTE